MARGVRRTIFLSAEVYILSPRPNELSTMISTSLPCPEAVSVESAPRFKRLISGMEGDFRNNDL